MANSDYDGGHSEYMTYGGAESWFCSVTFIDAIIIILILYVIHRLAVKYLDINVLDVLALRDSSRSSSVAPSMSATGPSVPIVLASPSGATAAVATPVSQSKLDVISSFYGGY